MILGKGGLNKKGNCVDTFFLSKYLLRVYLATLVLIFFSSIFLSMQPSRGL